MSTHTCDSFLPALISFIERAASCHVMSSSAVVRRCLLRVGGVTAELVAVEQACASMRVLRALWRVPCALWRGQRPSAVVSAAQVSEWCGTGAARGGASVMVTR
eukprot:5452428-Pleurochrysis_carterae.AAC.1